MSANHSEWISPKEYLERDRRDPWKNEYLDGRMTPIPHADPDHVLIASQLGAELHGHLKDTSFRAAMMRLRLHIPALNYYTFPDVMVLRDPAHFLGKGEETSVLDPILIAEVVAPETEISDRGERFTRYQQIASLSDYLLIFQTTPRAEHFTRQDDEKWKRHLYIGREAKITIGSIGCTLCLAEIYDHIQFSRE